jgi:GPI mannosyltransferase 3
VNFDRIKLLFTILFIVIVFAAAYNSHGYYHGDEHWQILEYSNYKIGQIPASQLAWEFNEKIRSGIQPAMVYGLIKALPNTTS